MSTKTQKLKEWEFSFKEMEENKHDRDGGVLSSAGAQAKWKMAPQLLTLAKPWPAIDLGESLESLLKISTETIPQKDIVFVL